VPGGSGGVGAVKAWAISARGALSTAADLVGLDRKDDHASVLARRVGDYEGLWLRLAPPRFWKLPTLVKRAERVASSSRLGGGGDSKTPLVPPPRGSLLVGGLNRELWARDGFSMAWRMPRPAGQQ